MYRWKYHWVALALGRLLQRHHPGAARVEVLGEALDRAALAGRVAPLEEDDEPLRRCAFTQYCSLSSSICSSRLCRSYSVAVHPLVVRVVLPPGVDRARRPGRSRTGSSSSESSTQ